MTAAARTALAFATVLAAAACETVPPPLLHGAAAYYEGAPPLAVIPPAAPRPVARLASARALGPAATLAPFFAALEASETGAAAEPVVIVQLGDSHSASDFLSGALRDLFQERFGAAGRGMLPPGVAYSYARPEFAEVAESEGWRRAGSLSGAGPFGIAGVLQQSAQAGARMTLTETEPPGFDRAFFEVLRQPGAGALRLRVDGGAIHEFATDAPAIGPHWIEFDAPRGSHALQLTAADERPVTVLAWGTQRRQRGIIYENLGVSGATIGVIGHWHAGTVAAELRRRAPALIVVAYGTNEAAAPPAGLTGYAERFAARVGQLSAASPQSAILVIGPPDVSRRAHGGHGECRAWTTPPGLAIVREAQRAAAARHGWYFWDWQEAMGGTCASDRWARLEPPLAAPDHVHLRPEGYRASAHILFAVLMDGYRRYRAVAVSS